jgi:hypothetical protein
MDAHVATEAVGRRSSLREQQSRVLKTGAGPDAVSDAAHYVVAPTCI